MSMRRCLLLLFGFTCAGHARQLRIRSAGVEGNPGKESQQFTKASGAPYGQSLTPLWICFHSYYGAVVRKPLKALAILLSERSPALAFNICGLGQPQVRHILQAPCSSHQPQVAPLFWEEVRSGKMDVSALEAGHDIDKPTPKLSRLHQAEYEVLQRIQQIPGMLRFSLAVHYSLLPKVVTPLLALIVWLSSLSRGATLITFVCASDCVNTALKWAVQRPRPRWYCPVRASYLVDSCGAWEVDLSFPSAHTMFFSGLAICASELYAYPMWVAAIFAVSVGLSRNYLSMHWPTDTLVGAVFGGVLGLVWGIVDPHAQLMAIADPLISLGFATSFTFGLLALMVATRQAVPPVTSFEMTSWFNNALCSVTPEERKKILTNNKKHLRPRSVKSKIPMLVTVWSTLALTAVYPALPHLCLEPTGSSARRFAHALIGVVGLGGIAALKKFVGDKLHPKMQSRLKVLLYINICVWTLLLSQITSGCFLDAVGLL